MQCSDFEIRLSAYHDNTLSAEEAEQVREHLSLCPACAEEQRQFEKLDNLLKKRTVPLPPDSYWGSLTFSILKQLETGRSQKSLRFLRHLIPLTAAAVFFLIISFSVLILTSDREPLQQKPEISYTKQMTDKTIELSNVQDVKQKAEKIVEVMNVHMSRLQEVSDKNQSEYVEQYALSYCKVVKNGISRIILDASSKGLNTEEIRHLFSRTGRAHVIEFREIIKLHPEKKETLEKAIDICKIL